MVIMSQAAITLDTLSVPPKTPSVERPEMTITITQNALLRGYKKRGAPKSRLTMLLEFYLILNFNSETGSTSTSRKAISDYTGWVFKSVSKAINELKEEGNWEVVENGSRTITFIPRYLSKP